MVIYINGWYNFLGFFSGYTLYFCGLLFYAIGEYCYRRDDFYYLSIFVIALHIMFIFIQLVFPDLYDKLFFAININIEGISRGYYLTGFRPTSIGTSFDLVIFGGFCYNYCFYIKRNYNCAFIYVCVLILLSVLLFSRSSTLIFILNLLFNLVYKRKLVSLLCLLSLGVSFLKIYSIDSVTVMDSTRDFNLDDGGRSNYIDQSLNYIFSHNYIWGQYSELINLEKAPHNVFINALLYFGIIGLILIVLIYLTFSLIYYKWFLRGYFEYLVVLGYFVKTLFHNESIVTSGSLVLLYLLGGSLRYFRSNIQKI